MKRLFISMTLLLAVQLAVTGTAVQAGEVTSIEQAKTIAGQAAGGARVVGWKTEHKRSGDTIYEMTLIDSVNRHEVEIRARDGSVVEHEIEPIYSPYGSPRPDGLSIEEAAKIALQRSGGGEIVEFDIDTRKSGRVVYEIEIMNGNSKHEVDIDADSSEVVKYKVERY